MLPDESPKQSIAQLSALPLGKRLETLRAILDPEERRQVARALPAEAYGEILNQSFLDNLNRNIQARAKGRNPGSRTA